VGGIVLSFSVLSVAVADDGGSLCNDGTRLPVVSVTTSRGHILSFDDASVAREQSWEPHCSVSYHVPSNPRTDPPPWCHDASTITGTTRAPSTTARWLSDAHHRRPRASCLSASLFVEPSKPFKVSLTSLPRPATWQTRVAGHAESEAKDFGRRVRRINIPA
jgi:hypothetical protein